MLHWWASLSLLKLQVLLRKESLQRGHVSSPRMFKSWERSSVQTTCAGVFSFVFGISLPVSSCVHLPCSSPSSPSLSLSSAYHQKEAKHSMWAIEFNVTKHSEEAAGGNLRVIQNARFMGKGSSQWPQHLSQTHICRGSILGACSQLLMHTQYQWLYWNI